jgi:hypothetical protein
MADCLHLDAISVEAQTDKFNSRFKSKLSSLQCLECSVSQPHVWACLNVRGR